MLKIYKEKGIIIHTVTGKVYLKDFISLKENEFKHSEYDSSFNTIFDFRKAELKLDFKDFNKISSFLKMNCEIIKKKKSALVFSNANQFVSSIMFEKSVKNLPFMINIFNTIEAANIWCES